MSVRLGTSRRLAISGATALLAFLGACSAESQETPRGERNEQPADNDPPSDHSDDAGSEQTTPTETTPPPEPPAELAFAPKTGATGYSVLTPASVKVTGGTLKSVVMTNPDGEQVDSRMTKDKKSWKSAEVLGYGKKYTIKTVAVNSEGKESTKTSSFTTVRPKDEDNLAMFPGPSVPTVGIGQPIDVTFDYPVTNKAEIERSLKVTTSPHQNGSWFWMDDQRVQWRPQVYWKPGTTVKVDMLVYGKELGNGYYAEADRHLSFRIHDKWVAIADANKHTLDIYHNDQLIKTILASFGKPSTPTHDGVHVVQEEHDVYLMNSATYGVPANAPGGYSNFEAYHAVRISNGGEFVHVNEGTIYAQGNTNVSHGCINVSMADGQWFREHFGYGDIVDVQNGSPTLPVWDGYGAWNVSWAEWQAGSALN